MSDAIVGQWKKCWYFLNHWYLARISTPLPIFNVEDFQWINLSWNFVCQVEIEFKNHIISYGRGGHKICWNIKTYLQFMVCNILIDFWKPKNKFFFRNRGLSHKILQLWNECGGPIEGNKHHFNAFLHFGCKFLLSEAITCQVFQLRINFEVF